MLLTAWGTVAAVYISDLRIHRSPLLPFRNSLSPGPGPLQRPSAARVRGRLGEAGGRNNRRPRPARRRAICIAEELRSGLRVWMLTLALKISFRNFLRPVKVCSSEAIGGLDIRVHFIQGSKMAGSWQDSALHDAARKVCVCARVRFSEENARNFPWFLKAAHSCPKVKNLK